MTRINVENYKKYAPLILRIGLALVFLWFGISQLVNTESFIGYIPSWISPHSEAIVHEHPLQLLHDVPIPSIHIIILTNGILETIFGFFLLIGLWTRVSAAILAVHLAGIAFGLGYNDIMIRDLGLALATASIFLTGPDRWCLDSGRRERRQSR